MSTKYTNKTFYKILNGNMCNKGFQFQLGLNKLKEDFNPSDECNGGGLYFSDLDHIFEWLSLYEDGLICEVRIPPYAQVYESKIHNKYKTNVIIISNPLQISTFIRENKLELRAVKQNGLALRYIYKQTDQDEIHAAEFHSLALKKPASLREICMQAVKEDGSALKYVKEQTQEICMKAVKQHGYLLQYVKNQTKEICMQAVRQDGKALEYVKDQTKELCMEAVKQNGSSLQYVKNQLPEIYMEAIKQNHGAFRYIRDKSNNKQTN